MFVFFDPRMASVFRRNSVPVSGLDRLLSLYAFLSIAFVISSLTFLNPFLVPFVIFTPLFVDPFPVGFSIFFQLLVDAFLVLSIPYSLELI